MISRHLMWARWIKGEARGSGLSFDLFRELKEFQRGLRRYSSRRRGQAEHSACPDDLLS
jgi:hypothetical protein